MPKSTKEEKRRIILETAVGLFARNGIDGTRTREIAEACGLSEPVLYQYFDSKEELYLEAMSTVHHEAMDTWYTLTVNYPDYVTALKELCSQRLHDLYKNRDLSSIGFSLVLTSNRNERIQAINRDLFTKGETLFISLVEKCKDEGSIRGELDPGAVVMMIRSFFWYVGVIVLVDLLDYISEEKAIKSMCDLIDALGPANQDSAL